MPYSLIIKSHKGYQYLIKPYIKNLSSSEILVQGYLFFLLITFSLLCIPSFQTVDVSLMDTLFIATSAVSTTGLVSVDPGSHYEFAGELVILLSIQIGGLGYMTFGSLILLSFKTKMSKAYLKSTLGLSRKDFALPSDFNVSGFIKKVFIFTFVAEAVGAIALYGYFVEANVENPIWSAIFHSISAFCTAGFSLMANSFESFQGHIGINLVLSVLSLLGGIGFIVFVDVYTVIKNRDKSLHFTTIVILQVTLTTLILGTLFIGLLDQQVAALANKERWLVAFFQTMTATTTVGFNTYPIALMSTAAIFLLYFFMLFGAAPSGTGGGLKSTSLVALIGIVRSTIKQRKAISYDDRKLPREKLQLASSSFIFAMMLIFVATISLTLTETAPIEWVLFEVFSALGTVGLSMGLTDELSDIGKLIVIVLMFIGRVGILTFGIFFALDERDEDCKDEDDIVL